MKTLDTYGEVTRRLALVAPDEALEKALKEKIQSWYKDAPGELPQTERGFIYEIQMSARRNERTITDKRKVYQLLKKSLGLDGLIAVLEIGLSVIDKHIPKSAQHAFIAEERSGYRTMTVVALDPALPKAA